MMSYGNSFSTVTRRKSEMKLKFFVLTCAFFPSLDGSDREEVVALLGTRGSG